MALQTLRFAFDKPSNTLKIMTIDPRETLEEVVTKTEYTIHSEDLFPDAWDGQLSHLSLANTQDVLIIELKSRVSFTSRRHARNRLLRSGWEDCPI